MFNNSKSKKVSGKNEDFINILYNFEARIRENTNFGANLLIKQL